MVDLSQLNGVGMEKPSGPISIHHSWESAKQIDTSLEITNKNTNMHSVSNNLVQKRKAKSYKTFTISFE